MKLPVRWCKIIIILVSCGLAACAAGEKQYKIGMQSKETGNYQEAITYLEEAIAAEPKNEKYRQDLKELKDALIQDLVSEAESALSSKTPPTIKTINLAKAKLSESEQVDPTNKVVVEFSARLQKEEQALLKVVQDYYSQAKKDVANGEWLKAYSNLQQIQSLFPNYEDSKEMILQVSSEGAQVLYEKAKSRFDQEDYPAAAEYLRQALTLNPGHSSAEKLLMQNIERDRKEYFIDKADKEVLEQNWKRAIELYEKAQTYDSNDETLKQILVEVKNKAAYDLIRKARTNNYAGWIGKAFEAYDLASKYISDSRELEFAEDIKPLTSEISNKAIEIADDFANQGNYGSAWFWYQRARTINPDYPEIFYRIQTVEDKVNSRIKKSIAIFDFEAPSNAPDAGSIFANSLSTFLFKTASQDIKILERENLKSILEEMKLGQIGVVSSNTAQEMGRVYGIDVAIMGSVLRYNVDSSSYSDTKAITYQVKETEENIEYLNWKARNPNPSKEDLGKAPTPYISKMKDVEKEYNVSIHKKVAFVTVSFRIIDVRTGENILVDTFSRTKTATDETSAGVEVAGIKYDPLEIPTDTELLQQLSDEVVSELSRESLRPLRNLEKIYYDMGEANLTRKDNIKAAEYFVDSIFDQKLKSSQDSPLTTDARKHLEDIFLDYKIQLTQ